MVVNHPHSKYSKSEIHFTPGVQKITRSPGADLCNIDGKTVSFHVCLMVSNEVSNFGGFNHNFLLKIGRDPYKFCGSRFGG